MLHNENENVIHLETTYAQIILRKSYNFLNDYISIYSFDITLLIHEHYLSINYETPESELLPTLLIFQHILSDRNFLRLIKNLLLLSITISKCKKVVNCGHAWTALSQFKGYQKIICNNIFHQKLIKRIRILRNLDMNQMCD